MQSQQMICNNCQKKYVRESFYKKHIEKCQVNQQVEITSIQNKEIELPKIQQISESISYENQSTQECSEVLSKSSESEQFIRQLNLFRITKSSYRELLLKIIHKYQTQNKQDILDLMEQKLRKYYKQNKFENYYISKSDCHQYTKYYENIISDSGRIKKLYQYKNGNDKYISFYSMLSYFQVTKALDIKYYQINQQYLKIDDDNNYKQGHQIYEQVQRMQQDNQLILFRIESIQDNDNKIGQHVEYSYKAYNIDQYKYFVNLYKYQKSYHEVMANYISINQRLVFDLDINPNFIKEESDRWQFYQNFKKILYILIKDRFLSQRDKEQMYTFNSNKEIKIYSAVSNNSQKWTSFHVYSNLYTTSDNICLYIIPLLRQQLKHKYRNSQILKQEQIDQIIDSNIYASKMKKKQHKNSKVNIHCETTTLRSILSDKIKNNSIQWRQKLPLDEGQGQFRLQDYMITILDYSNMIELSIPYQFTKQNHFNIKVKEDYDSDDDIYYDDEIELETYVDKFFSQYNIENYKQIKNYEFLYTYKDKVNCPLCNTDRHSSEYNRTIVFSISEDRQKIIVSCKYGQVNHKSTHNSYVFNINGKLKQKKEKKKQYYMEQNLEEQFKQYNKYIQFDINQKITYVKSHMGTGKTTQLSKLLAQDQYKNMKMLFISTRISFTNSMIKSLNEQNLNFIPYNKIQDNEQLNNTQQLMIQLESITRINKQFDIIILDEFESILQQLNSNIKDKTSLFEKLNLLMKYSKKLIVMDAQLTNNSIKLIQQQMDNNISYKIYNNIYSPYDDKYFNIYKSKNQQQSFKSYLNHIEQSLNNNRKIISMNTCELSLQKTIQYLVDKKLINKSEIAYIHGKDRKQQEHSYDNQQLLEICHILFKKDIYENPGLLKNYKMIIYTQSITVGIDLQLKGFDHIHLYNQMFCNVTQFIQGIHRNRIVNESQNIYLQNYNQQQLLENLSTSPYYCLQQLLQKNIYNEMLQRKSDFESWEIAIKTQQQSLYKYHNILLRQIPEHMGYEVVEIDLKDDEEQLKVKLPNNFKIKQEDLQLEISSKDIQQYIKIKNQGTNSLSIEELQDKQINQKYHIINVILKSYKQLLQQYEHDFNIQQLYTKFQQIKKDISYSDFRKLQQKIKFGDQQKYDNKQQITIFQQYQQYFQDCDNIDNICKQLNNKQQLQDYEQQETHNISIAQSLLLLIHKLKSKNLEDYIDIQEDFINKRKEFANLLLQNINQNILRDLNNYKQLQQFIENGLIWKSTTIKQLSEEQQQIYKQILSLCRFKYDQNKILYIIGQLYKRVGIDQQNKQLQLNNEKYRIYYYKKI